MKNRCRTMAAMGLAAGLGAAAQGQEAARPLITHADQVAVPRSPFQPDLTPGYVLIEGDIQVRLNEYLQMLAGADSAFTTGALWPNRTIPMDFTGNVTGANQNLAHAAMDVVEAMTGVVFVPAVASDPNRMRIQNSGFNSAPIGMQGGIQIVNIANWNNQIIIIHELFHTLGFWHEQARPDRGLYVTINNANICGSGSSVACQSANCCLCLDNAGVCFPCAFNFNPQAAAVSLGLYDFDSMMHYGQAAFSCNGSNTITVNAPYTAWQTLIGQRTHVSWLDQMSARGLYPENGDFWLDSSHGGLQVGTMTSPFNTGFATLYGAMPTGGAILIKNSALYPALGTYNRAMTIYAATGPVTLGN